MKLVTSLLVLFVLARSYAAAQEPAPDPEDEIWTIGEEAVEGAQWSVGLNGGRAFPVAPDKFSDVYEPGFALGASFGYNIISTFSAGAFLEYSSFRHTGRPFQLRNQEMRCIEGGDKSSTSTGLFVRAEFLHFEDAALYLNLAFGVASVLRQEAVYSVFGYNSTAPSTTIVNEYCHGTVGIDLPIFWTVRAGVEAGYQLASDGAIENQFLSAKVAVRAGL